MTLQCISPVDGRLYGWLFNCAHQREIGGPVPGGFCQDANTVYEEAPFVLLVDEVRLARDDPVTFLAATMAVRVIEAAHR